jgi:hypothetical protein
MAYTQRKATNKFSAKRSEYNGRWYHSRGEASYAMELDWLMKAGEIKEWKPQHLIDLKVNGIHITNYYIDFRVITKYDSVQLIEYKGMETQDWRIKWNLLHATLQEIEPGAELILVKHVSKYKPR